MIKPHDPLLISDWADLICNLSQHGQSVAIGIFNDSGALLHANPAMAYFLHADPTGANPTNHLVNPDLQTLLSIKSDGLIFDGLMTIGNYGDCSYVLSAKVFRKLDAILIYAEADVPHLFKENCKMSTLNQEINNLQRQLIKEKNKLQSTLSELKETQQLLIHSEKMNAMGKLVAGVAHELNNPIAFVYSNLFSLEKSVLEVFQSLRQIENLVSLNGDQKLIATINQLRKENELDYLEEDLSDMTKESKIGVERVKSIVEDLRRFSRLDESQIKHIDLIENIRSTISIAKSELNKKEIAFAFEGIQNLSIECFPGQLNQAILNVLMNAVDAVQIGGHITLTVSQDDQFSCISITDDGCGIPEDIMPLIFDPFFTTKPVGSGTGLGLSITYKIIHDLHHGFIHVESAMLKGTTFQLFIPKII